MFFLISKVAGYVVLPSNIIGLLGISGMFALILGFRRTGLSFLAMSVALLAILGWSPAGPAALLLLENRFPQPSITGPVAGIIMLGGAVDTHITAGRHSPALNEAAERLTATAELARLHPDARVLLSGGANHLVHDNSPTSLSVYLKPASALRSFRATRAKTDRKPPQRFKPSQGNSGCW